MAFCVFVDALYFWHFRSFYTMQLEPPKIKAGWYFQVHIHVLLLRRESSTQGQVGWLHTRGIRDDGGFKKTASSGHPVGLPNSWGKMAFTA